MCQQGIGFYDKIVPLLIKLIPHKAVSATAMRKPRDSLRSQERVKGSKIAELPSNRGGCSPNDVGEAYDFRVVRLRLGERNLAVEIEREHEFISRPEAAIFLRGHSALRALPRII